MFTILKEIKKGDYIYALVPDHPNATKNGYVLMHRVIMENHLGRLLGKDEVVHHKDHNKFNNSVDNLEVMDKMLTLRYMQVRDILLVFGLLVLTVEGYSCVVGTDITQRVHVTFVQGIATEHSILKIDN